ncbi:MAG: TetR family transcriptional regulator [Bacillales bacterium]|jgi:AcrR family transcriptional regulator|nr:TetR family transcriptional regulator [Bacillales bacterium]
MENKEVGQEQLTEKQQRIVDAAIEIFAAKGYSGASTSEIAKKAGVAEGTIFRRYKTKKELLMSIVGPMISKVIAPIIVKDFDKVITADYKDFESFLRAIFSNRLKLVEKNQILIKIAIQEIPFHPELKEKLFEVVGKEVFKSICQRIEDFQLKGEIVKIHPKLVVQLIFSSLFGYVASNFILFPERSVHQDNELEHTIQFILKGLRQY